MEKTNKNLNGFLSRCIALGIFGIAVGTANAQQLTVNDAMANAKAFLASESAAAEAKVRGGVSSNELQLAYTSKTEDDVNYYVFNQSGDNGFVIVAGDESSDKQILAYTTHGSFDYAKVPDNVRWWLGQMETSLHQQILDARVRPAESLSRRRTASAERANVADLITTKWGQDYPFNKDIPTFDPDYQFVAGCVPIAFVQVMNKWKYPEHGTGSNQYVQKYKVGDDMYSVTFSADFANTTYNFNKINLQSVYTVSEFQDYVNEVAKLTYHFGVAANIRYSVDFSGGYDIDGALALANNFKYDKGLAYESRSYYSDQEWENMIYRELSEGRPVIYSGAYTTGEGHCFVCHGYKDGLYAFNWGWYGECDGYYAISGTDALDGDRTNFTESQNIITGIQPDQGNLPALRFTSPRGVSPIILYTDEVDVTSVSIAPLTVSIVNIGLFDVTYQYGVKAVGKNTGKVVYYSFGEATDKRNTGTSRTPVLPLSVFTDNDTYVLSAVYRQANSTSDGDWQEVLGGPAEEDKPCLIVKGIDESATLANIDYTLNSSQWGTICLPFTTVIPNGLRLFNVYDVTYDEEVDLDEEYYYLYANTPYLVYGEPGNYQFQGYAQPADETVQHGILVGVLSDNVLLQKNDYVLQHPDGVPGFYLISESLANKYYATKYRAILRLEEYSGLSRLRINLDNISTGIPSPGIAGSSDSTKSIYGLDGRERSSLTNGVNIVKTADGRCVKVVK